MFSTAVLKITFSPASSPFQVCAWGDLVEVGGLPMRQLVQRDNIMGADDGRLRARGNVIRTWIVRVRANEVRSDNLVEDMLDKDAAFPVGVTAPLHVRVLDLSVASTASEASRTKALYYASECVMEMMEPEVADDGVGLETTFVLQLNRLVKQV